MNVRIVATGEVKSVPTNEAVTMLQAGTAVPVAPKRERAILDRAEHVTAIRHGILR